MPSISTTVWLELAPRKKMPVLERKLPLETNCTPGWRAKISRSEDWPA